VLTSEDWHDLRVGDRIRFTVIPTGFSLENCHEETLEAYRTLIARRRSVRVYELDQLKVPWIRFRIKLADGTWENHSLLINHDGWVRVRPRNRGR
jgi:hypothetical protein